LGYNARQHRRAIKKAREVAVTTSSIRSALSGLVFAAALAGAGTASAQELNAALKELVAAANKEGTLTLSGSGSTFAGIQGAARYQAAINKMFGTNLRVNFLPGPDMARIANQLATEYTASQRSHVDLLLAASPQITPLVKLDFFERVDWKQYLPHRITDQMIELDGRIVRVVTGLSGATYNSRLAPMNPTRLADFLRPEWKGKIASTPYSAGFDVLYAEDVWGKERTIEYVTKLTGQLAGLIRCGEAERIATGEYLALVMDCTGQDALQWQEKGAPVGQMMPLDAAQQRYYYFAVPKNAQHPYAAKLYAIFQLTEEGQRLSYETWKTDLHFLPGSRMGAMVESYRKQNVPFKEVTVEWQLQHPEINAGRSELIKILTTKQ